MILGFLTLLLFAQTAAQPTPPASSTQSGVERVVYEISRLRNFDDERLPAALIAAAVIALVAVVWYLYRRDTLELGRLPRFVVVLLRFVALAGLLIFFLGIERRTTREVVHNSQVAVLVDVSQSMALGETENASEASRSRIQTVVQALSGSPLVSDIRQSHDVNVARFEREYLEARLRRHQGNVKTAAEEACLPRGTLYRLMKNHGLDGDDFRS